MTYLKHSHFVDIAPAGAKLTRLSAKAMQYETDKNKGIIYVNTVVAEINESGKSIMLNTGGRHTNTTKKRINNMINQFGYKLYQKSFERLITTPDGEIINFNDYMSINI